MARTIVLNAKMRRTGICGAMETLLIDREFAAPAAVITALLDAGCEVRGDTAVRAIDGRVKARSEEHTSELQSLMRISYAVFCLKKKTKINAHATTTTIHLYQMKK